MEQDELDPNALHWLARDAQARAIGTVRLTPAHQLGRMAVLASERHRGVGQALLAAALAGARARGWPRVWLHAQLHAVEFYRRAGFQVSGAEFTEAGIRHLPMRAHL